MSKSLKEIRASKAPTLPERTVEMCLAQHLVAEVEQLEAERQDLVQEKQTLIGSAPDQQPKKKLADGADPRVAAADARLGDVDARLVELGEEMREFTGNATFRGEGFGPWRTWADAHPARAYDPDNAGTGAADADPELAAAARFDFEVTFGFCNGSDLLARLGDFAVAWNGDPLEADDWETIAERAAGGDLKEAARKVVEMHEGGGVRAPKSRTPSPATSTP